MYGNAAGVTSEGLQDGQDQRLPNSEDVMVKYLGKEPDMGLLGQNFRNNKKHYLSPQGVWWLLRDATIEEIAGYAQSFDENYLIDGDFSIDNSLEIITITLKHLFDFFGPKQITIDFSRDIDHDYFPDKDEQLEIHALVTYVIERLGGDEKIRTVLAEIHRRVSTIT